MLHSNVWRKQAGNPDNALSYFVLLCYLYYVRGMWYLCSLAWGSSIHFLISTQSTVRCETPWAFLLFQIIVTLLSQRSINSGHWETTIYLLKISSINHYYSLISISKPISYLWKTFCQSPRCLYFSSYFWCTQLTNAFENENWFHFSWSFTQDIHELLGMYVWTGHMFTLRMYMWPDEISLSGNGFDFFTVWIKNHPYFHS